MPILITMDLISEITGFPKDGADPSQYFRGRDNYKRLAARLKETYDLQRGSREYCINSIIERVVRIGAWILASKIVTKNHPV